jgi:hypothetical protein
VVQEQQIIKASGGAKYFAPPFSLAFGPHLLISQQIFENVTWQQEQYGIF